MLSSSFGISLHINGDGSDDRFLAKLIFKEDCFHGHKIDHTLEIGFTANRQLHRNNVS
ncbi:MAG: hypothetical protein ACD_34C00337G0001, partial [uncultured bacterium]